MAMQALLRRAPRLAMRAPRATKPTTMGAPRGAAPRPFATFDETGQQQPTKEANETFVRTPFIGDGYFNDEMGELYEYTVAVGDSVAADDTVAVVDTHKASVDIRTPVAGTVSRLLNEPGDKMWEIQPILTLISDVPSSSPRVKMKK